MHAIPAEVKPLLIPSPNLSILGLLKYPLPMVLSSLLSGLETQDFFNTNQLTGSLSSISQILSPPWDFTILLQKNLAETTRRGINSVKCGHSRVAAGQYYLLWIITYWVKVNSIRHIHDIWRAAEHYLHERSCSWKAKGNSEGVTMVKQILDALSVLRWDDQLRGFSKNSIEGLESLAVYASNKWLKDEHANQMLDLLRKDLE